MTDLPIIAFETQADWEAWLAAHYTDTKGLWLKLAKKNAPNPTVTYQEALDVALCFGWIDGQKNKFDEHYWLQKFTPRRKNSPWSRINRDKAMTLIDAGKMRPTGLAEIERAQAYGRWDAAYHSPSTMTVPDDFQAALAANPNAQAFFDQLNKTNTYAILYRITTAKKPETRQKQIDKFIAMLNEGKKLY